ncbi:hypothetical protein [uncultured Acetobacteroides sp.]|uniref:hypothetical protein n=1 Tax=uncultured Acetobacteroides sp. TaxID=1760811 RepID=UPI0029F560C4|nr:hypothetical protein [uncultured Acetobacteroides sp.]
MKRRKVVYGIVIVLITLLITGFVFRNRLLSSLIIGELLPREPRNQIETVTDIGWWAFQDELKIDNFTVKIVESKLNLFNNYSLISYTVKGELKGNNNWKPYISNIHISQRFIRKYNRELHPYLDKDTSKIPEALIEITPIVRTKENKSYKGEVIQFCFTNELKIQSFHYGDNWIRFKCDSLQNDIVLKQRK